MPPAPERTFEQYAATAEAHHAAGRLEAAAEAYRAALALRPAHPVATHNLAVVTATLGAHRDAIPLFDAAIAAEPRYASAHYNRAAALHAIADLAAALDGYRRTCALEPAHYQAHRNAAFLALASHDRPRALDHFARTCDLRRGDDHTTLTNPSLTTTCRHKLVHDAAQFRFLANRHRDKARFEHLARCYEEAAREAPLAPSQLTSAQRHLLGDGYNTAINVFGAAEFPGNTISPGLDASAITTDIAASGAATIDNLLTPPAFTRLSRFLLESTVWHDFSHIGGFVASYLEDGLASPLLLQIVDEFRHRLPGLLRETPLVQAWAFKGLTPEASVALHADDAALSLNLWMTPATANRNPATGGLTLCTTAPPAGWTLPGYDTGQRAAAEFLAANPATTITIPYRENRAVLFRSRYIHGSDRPDFAPGYENHRINLTLLFGAAKN